MTLIGKREPLGRAPLAFNFLVGAAGLAALVVATTLRFGEGPEAPLPPPLSLLATFLALFVLARWLRFEIPAADAPSLARLNITASLVVPVQMASILLLGPLPTAWLALPAFLIEVVRERPLSGLTGRRLWAMWGIIAFNLGMEALVTLGAGACWLALRPGPRLQTTPASLAALVATLVAFKLLNEALMVTGHWLRGVSVRDYLAGARLPVVIETLTLPLAALLVVIKSDLPPAAFYLFIVVLLLGAFVVRSLTRTRGDLERRVREVATLSEVGRAISADIELDSLLETIEENCRQILPSGHFYIALWNEGETALRIAIEVIGGERRPPHDLSLGEGLTSHVIESRRPLLVRDLLEERDRLPARPLVMDGPPNRTWLGVPMIARGEVVGAVVLQDPRPGAYDDGDLRILLSVASQAAISIKNARLHQEALHALRVEAENRELKALTAKKSEFVNMVAHQFRTPLTTVIGYANLLLERARRRGDGEAAGVPDLERHLSTVHAESRRLAQMVEELLNLSRIRSGTLPLTLQTFDVNAVLRETISAHELLAGERGLELALEAGGEPLEPGGAPALRARGDSNFIRQVLGNLVSNAVKYAPAGTRVVVSSRGEGESVRVEVVDEGPGVPAGDLERIFDEFYRAPGPTLDLPGTGLGLSICRGILEAHGNRCWAERRGGGTAFCFRLPRPVPATEPAAAAGG